MGHEDVENVSPEARAYGTAGRDPAQSAGVKGGSTAAHPRKFGSVQFSAAGTAGETRGAVPGLWLLLVAVGVDSFKAKSFF